MNKPLVLYHANCADGYAAAFAAWLTLGDEAEYVACSYGETSFVDMLEKVDCKIDGREIFVLDFSFKKPDMDNLFNCAKRVVWLDHHLTAFQMWCEYPTTLYELHTDKHHYITLDNNKSGACLAWEFFHPTTEVPEFIKFIDDYDRWIFQYVETKNFNKGLWSYAPWSFKQWQDMFFATTVNGEPYSTHINTLTLQLEGEAILRAHDQNVQSVVKGSEREVVIPPQDNHPTKGLEQFSGLSANCPAHLTSDVGHELATQSGTYGLCWTLGKEGLVAKCSLRSNGDYDVSAIAKSFGGGGHRNAAGFEVPVDVLLGWMK